MRLRVLIWLAAIGFTVGALGLALLYSGIVTVAATSGHSALVEWALTVAMRRSVEHHASGIKAPPLDEPSLIHLGLRFFETDCVPCHGAPGVPRADANSHLLPVPPELSKIVGDWEPRDLFWIVKHGIKSTGMPAWGPSHRDDEIWASVAFMQHRLAGLSSEQYRTITQVGPANAIAEEIGQGRLVALAGPAARQSTACARCHGMDGTGHASGAFPRIDGQDLAYLDNAMKSYASGERPSGIMTSIVRGLSEEERKNVTEYYARLERKPRASGSFERDARFAIGRELAEHGAISQGVPPCAECHGRDGLAPTPGIPHLAGQHPAYIATQLRLWRSSVRGADGNSAAMAEIARRLTDEQIDAASLYYGAM